MYLLICLYTDLNMYFIKYVVNMGFFMTEGQCILWLA